ncbi:hypothetical protein, partial [Massilia sp. TWP1-3-3]|uniref:hypothetical protein n=1 Tax=Massilia sp. TWP1-3-3 TaxID=2804573 RepID=UPI003CF4AA87
RLATATTSALDAGSVMPDGCSAAGVMFNSICVPTSLIRLMKLSHNSLTQGALSQLFVIFGKICDIALGIAKLNCKLAVNTGYFLIGKIEDCPL